MWRVFAILADGSIAHLRHLSAANQDGTMKQEHKLSYAYSLAYIVAAFAAATTVNSQVIRTDHLHERGRGLRQPLFPLAFHGHWSVDLRDCGQPATEDSQLWITAKSFNYYETNGKVTRIAVEKLGRAVATVRSEGEGTIFVSKKGLTLSPDRSSLTVRDEDDTGSTTFRRCSTTETAPDIKIADNGQTHIVADTVDGRIDAVISTRLATSLKPKSAGVSRCSGGRTSCSLVDSVSIVIGKNSVVVPERAELLLADVNRGRITRLAAGHYELILNCGDAAVAYDAHLFFNRKVVNRMDLWASEAGEIQQSTIYKDVSKAFK